MFIQHENLCINLQQCVYFKCVDFAKGSMFNGTPLETDTFGLEFASARGTICITSPEKGVRDQMFEECAIIGKAMIANVLRASSQGIVKASPVVMPFKH